MDQLAEPKNHTDTRLSPLEHIKLLGQLSEEALRNLCLQMPLGKSTLRYYG